MSIELATLPQLPMRNLVIDTLPIAQHFRLVTPLFLRTRCWTRTTGTWSAYQNLCVGRNSTWVIVNCQLWLLCQLANPI